MEYLVLIGTITVIHLLGVMSPGPDFIMCVRNSLTYSRKTGIMTAAGLALGMLVHILYCLAGLAMIISKSIIIFNIIKIFGAVYLIYIGFRSIFSKSDELKLEEQIKKEDISSISAIKIGFLTNVLNPKATIFFLGLFTIVISPNTPAFVMAIISIIMIVNSFLWFAIVSILLTQNKIRLVYNKFQNIINKTMGGLLIALGIKVALTDK